MSEQAPAYVTALDHVWPKAEVLARVFGISRDELVARAISDGLDALLEDDDVRAAFDALQRIGERWSAERAPQAEQQQTIKVPVRGRAAVDRQAHNLEVAGSIPAPATTSTSTDPDPDDGDEEVEQHRPEPSGSKSASAPSTAERQRAASVILTARQRRGLTQREVAQQVGGVSDSTVSLAEKAGPTVSPAKLRRLVAWATVPDRTA